MGKINVNDQEVFGSPALGETSLNGIGDGTVTSAIVALKNENNAIKTRLANVEEQSSSAWNDVESVRVLANRAQTTANAAAASVVEVGVYATSANTNATNAKRISSDAYNAARSAETTSNSMNSIAEEAKTKAQSALDATDTISDTVNSIITGKDAGQNTVKVMNAKNAELSEKARKDIKGRNIDVMIDNIMDGTWDVASAEEAYADSEGHSIADQFSDIKDGSTTVGKANKDGDGNIINATYLSELKLNGIKLEAKTKDAKTLYSVTLPNANSSTSGLMSASDKQKVDNLPSSIPSNWKTWLEGSNASGRLYQIADTVSPEQGDTFAFFTDFHSNNNVGNTSDIIEYLSERFGLSFAVFGGDIQNGSSSSTTDDELAAMTYKMRGGFKKCKLFCVTGNHDYNGDKYSEGRVFTYLHTHNHLDMHRDGSILNYYVDNPTSKIRYFFLSDIAYGEKYKEGTAEWFRTQLTNVPNDYDVFIFSHAGVSASDSGYTCTSINNSCMRQCIAIAAKFNKSRGSNGKVLGVLSGHNHMDAHYYVKGTTSGPKDGYLIYADSTNWSDSPSGAFPVISTVCDALRSLSPVTLDNGNTYSTFDEYRNAWGDANKKERGLPVSGTDKNGRARAKGQYTEHAIDIVSIDKTNSRIRLARIGVGQDTTKGSTELTKVWNNGVGVGIRNFGFSKNWTNNSVAD